VTNMTCTLNASRQGFGVFVTVFGRVVGHGTSVSAHTSFCGIACVRRRAGSPKMDKGLRVARKTTIFKDISRESCA
jgi:hypothetical protein